MHSMIPCLKYLDYQSNLQSNKRIPFTHFLKNDPIVDMWLLPNIEMLSVHLNTMHSDETLVNSMKDKALPSRFTC